jgi:multidrug resistance protein, MATE family
LNRKILRLAIPNIISNLSVPLLSTVDTAIVGRLDHVYYLGAIAVGGMIFNIIYWGFGFLRMGTTGLTAQAFGGGNRSEEASVLGRAMLVALTGSVLVILFQVPIIDLCFRIIDSSAEVEEFARVYFMVRIWAAPATLSLYALQGWFLGMQNARYPMILTIFVNLVNIGCTLFFVYGLGMTVEGVALGTVCAQYSGLVLGLILFRRRYGSVAKSFSMTAIRQVDELKRFFLVNRDIFIRTLCLIFAFSFFTAKSAEAGDEILAVNTILLQLWHILAYGVDGFAFAAESLVGRYTGAKDRKNLRLAIRYNLYWGLGIGLAVSVAYFALQEQILFIFTDKEEVIALAMAYFIWTVFAPLINSFCFIWDGVFIGATATAPMRDSMIMASFLVYLPVYYLTVPHIGNHSLWLAMTAFMVARGIALLWYSKSYIYADD